MARVLVMEDEPGIRMVLKMALSDEGHEVVTVPDGKLGMQSLEEESTLPDIVLVDLFMPGISGCQVVESMCARARLKNIPIIILTGSDVDWVNMPPENSYKALIRKPFELNDVINTVNTLTKYTEKTA
ncbi:MAG: response regulator transcription factor [Bacillota bacterium]